MTDPGDPHPLDDGPCIHDEHPGKCDVRCPHCKTPCCRHADFGCKKWEAQNEGDRRVAANRKAPTCQGGTIRARQTGMSVKCVSCGFDFSRERDAECCFNPTDPAAKLFAEAPPLPEEQRRTMKKRTTAELEALRDLPDGSLTAVEMKDALSEVVQQLIDAKELLGRMDPYCHCSTGCDVCEALTAEAEEASR